MKKIFFYCLSALFIVTSCSKDLTDLNVDPKAASDVPAGTLLAYAIKNIARQDAEVSPNYNPFRLLTQQWTATQYLDESNWNFTNRNIPQTTWNVYYRTCLNNLELAKKAVNAKVEDSAQKKTQLAMIDILEVYVYHNLVTTFGNIPYSEALNPDITFPKYDDQATVYKDLITRLQADILNLSDAGDIASYDLMCGGSVTKWKKFASSLLLKLGVGISDYDAAVAGTAVSKAISTGVISAKSENTILKFQGSTPNTNPSYEYFLTRPQEYVGCNTLISYMNSLSDPRLPFYFTTVSGNYVGGNPGAKSIYANFSKPSAKVKEATLEYLFMDYSEVEFLLAEAASRNLGGATGAETHYNNAVKASVEYWGGTTASATTLLAAAPFDAANWKKSIGMQAWVAMYNRGSVAWVFQRRLDFPVLPNPAAAIGSGLPVRYLYPTFEQNNNATNYSAASSAIGGDVPTTKLFWDKF